MCLNCLFTRLWYKQLEEHLYRTESATQPNISVQRFTCLSHQQGHKASWAILEASRRLGYLLRVLVDLQSSVKHTRICIPWCIGVVDGRLTLQPCQVTELRRDESRCRALVHEVTWSRSFLVLWSTNGNSTSIKPETRSSPRQYIGIEPVVVKEDNLRKW